jgi:hypothetical protein
VLIRTISVSVLALSTLSAWAAPDPVAIPSVPALLKYSHCGTQATNLLANWGSSDRWIQRTPLDSGEKVLETPTEEVGVWIQGSFSAGQPPVLVKRSDAAEIKVTWKDSDCTPQLGVTPVEGSIHTIKDAPYTDEMLKTALGKGGSGIVYAWSPQMPLSVWGFNEAKAMAKKLKMDFVPVLDPGADPATATQLSKEKHLANSLHQITSVELMERGMNLHYPSILVFKNGKIVGSLIPGYWDEASALQASIEGAMK